MTAFGLKEACFYLPSHWALNKKGLPMTTHEWVGGLFLFCFAFVWKKPLREGGSFGKSLSISQKKIRLWQVGQSEPSSPS
jgi:hypothetical protein